MRFEDVLGRSERSELSQMEAAELLGISERTFRRWRDRHREAGLSGLDDRRLAPSLRRAPVAEIERMLGLYQDLYRGFTVKHFHEQLVKRHNYSLGYTVTKLHLHREGLVHRAKKRSAHRKKRPRRPMVGMMGSFTQRYVKRHGPWWLFRRKPFALWRADAFLKPSRGDCIGTQVSGHS